MDRHKRALFAAWRAHPLWGYEGSKFDILQGHPPIVLGGEKVVRQVREFLREELKLARAELELAYERWRGSEWWDLYIEGPVEKDLQDTLRQFVPRRRNESAKDYAERLKAVEAAFRARLPSYERHSFGETDEDD